MADYPVFVSPDGDHEQVAPTPADQVRLRYRGWAEKPASSAADTAVEMPAEKPKPRQRARAEK